MEFANIAIGTDIEKTERFKRYSSKDSDMLDKIFTPKELEYCFSKSKYYLNLCGRYCAKEAVVKALSEFGIKDIYYSDIETLNEPDGKPVCKIKKYPNIKIKISISHCSDYATANVFCVKE